MIAVDTNILIYAHRSGFPLHTQARVLLDRLANGTQPWAIPWPCISEFLRVVTHTGILDPPTPLTDALATVGSLVTAPSVVMLGPGPAHWRHLRRMLRTSRVVGNAVFDAQIAAIAVEHGVSEVWTRDRDFHRFPGIHVRNPFPRRDDSANARHSSDS